MSLQQQIAVENPPAQAMIPNILIVEDDEVDFRATRRMLVEIFGDDLKIGWTCDWKEASEALNDNNYDVYLIDYFLGGKNRSGTDRKL